MTLALKMAAAAATAKGTATETAAKRTATAKASTTATEKHRGHHGAGTDVVIVLCESFFVSAFRAAVYVLDAVTVGARHVDALPLHLTHLCFLAVGAAVLPLGKHHNGYEKQHEGEHNDETHNLVARAVGIVVRR